MALRVAIDTRLVRQHHSGQLHER